MTAKNRRVTQSPTRPTPSSDESWVSPYLHKISEVGLGHFRQLPDISLCCQPFFEVMLIFADDKTWFIGRIKMIVSH